MWEAGSCDGMSRCLGPGSRSCGEQVQVMAYLCLGSSSSGDAGSIAGMSRPPFWRGRSEQSLSWSRTYVALLEGYGHSKALEHILVDKDFQLKNLNSFPFVLFLMQHEVHCHV